MLCDTYHYSTTSLQRPPQNITDLAFNKICLSLVVRDHLTVKLSVDNYLKVWTFLLWTHCPVQVNSKICSAPLIFTKLSQVPTTNDDGEATSLNFKTYYTCQFINVIAVVFYREASLVGCLNANWYSQLHFSYMFWIINRFLHPELIWWPLLAQPKPVSDFLKY